MLAETQAAERAAPQGKREFKVTEMMLRDPQIRLQALETITAPTLVLASDHDAIRDEHTLDIYHHLPNSQLVIFPNATHMIPYDDPVLFNTTVERFLRAPFVKKDRIQDLLKSMEALKASQQ
jgi:pimeloyl-ACP methyl ester carboxylesterase